MTGLNRQAIEYWLEGHDIDYQEMDWGYVLEDCTHLKNNTLGEISACGGHLKISTTDEFLIIDPKAEGNDE